LKLGGADSEQPWEGTASAAPIVSLNLAPAASFRSPASSPAGQGLPWGTDGNAGRSRMGISRATSAIAMPARSFAPPRCARLRLKPEVYQNGRAQDDATAAEYLQQTSNATRARRCPAMRPARPVLCESRSAACCCRPVSGKKPSRQLAASSRARIAGRAR